MPFAQAGIYYSLGPTETERAVLAKAFKERRSSPHTVEVAASSTAVDPESLESASFGRAQRILDLLQMPHTE